MLNIVTIVGARPQFIKAAPVTRALRKSGYRGFLVHTGQHYDDEMSAIFFREMGIPEPDVNLGIGSGSHGWQTGQMLVRIEEVLLAEKPDSVLVYGDTNSTIAGALAACKLHIPLAHVEAGLRSYNRKMPEEHNRVLADHCADLLFCPTQTAVDNLRQEGITHGIHLVGDTMYDAMLQFSKTAQQQSTILQKLHLNSKEYLLATVHRPYNTDSTENLGNILQAFLEIGETIVFPVHPRTQQKIAELDVTIEREYTNSKVKMIDPVGYIDMLMLEQNARLILTDSGGMQKEAYFLKIPCITLRPETEWVETVEAGWNKVVGADKEKILQAVSENTCPITQAQIFGDGLAARKIVAILASCN